MSETDQSKKEFLQSLHPIMDGGRVFRQEQRDAPEEDPLLHPAGR